MSPSTHSYRYRPYYYDPEVGPRGKMIDFSMKSDEMGLIREVLEAIREIQPKASDPEDMFPIFETWVKFSSEKGNGHFTIGDYGFVFLEGKSELLDVIDRILAAHPNFSKESFHERDYYQKKKQ